MKKTLCILLCMTVMLVFAACGGDKEENSSAVDYTYEIAFLTPFTEISIDDEDRMEAAWNGVRQFAEENGKTYKYYEAEANNTKAQLSRIQDAVEAGAKVIVAVGPEVEEAIAEAQNKFKDVKFIYLDGTLDKTADNCVIVRFEPLQAGFLAGYGAVIEGLGNLGYLADGENAESIAYGYGFLQGANEAAMRFGRYAVIRYRYGDKDNTKEDIGKIAETWYDDGMRAIFTYGGHVFKAVKAEAEKADRIVIGSNASKEYSKTVITSARKCYEAVVVEQLKKAYEKSFEGGKTIYMNAKNGGVGLDMKHSKFQYFNQTLYDDIYKELAKGEMEVFSAKDAKTVDELVKAKWLYYIRIDQE